MESLLQSFFKQSSIVCLLQRSMIPNPWELATPYLHLELLWALLILFVGKISTLCFYTVWSDQVRYFRVISSHFPPPLDFLFFFIMKDMRWYHRKQLRLIWCPKLDPFCQDSRNRDIWQCPWIVRGHRRHYNVSSSYMANGGVSSHQYHPLFVPGVYNVFRFSSLCSVWKYI